MLLSFFTVSLANLITQRGTHVTDVTLQMIFNIPLLSSFSSLNLNSATWVTSLRSLVLALAVMPRWKARYSVSHISCSSSSRKVFHPFLYSLSGLVSKYCDAMYLSCETFNHFYWPPLPPDLGLLWLEKCNYSLISDTEEVLANSLL